MAITATFNADCDGDEMNIHVPQNEKASTELSEISSVKQNLISTQSSKPIVSMVQDTLLAWYLMTKDDSIIPQDEFFDILIRADNIDYIKKFQHIKSIYKEKNKQTDIKYTGKILLSCILPEDFYYQFNDIEIYKGVHLSGAISNKQLGKSHGAFVQLIAKEYNPDICVTFINNIQNFAYQWMCYHSFSVNLDDCMANSDTTKEDIKRTIATCYIEANSLKKINHPLIRETRTNEILNKARDIGMRIAKDVMSKSSNFLDLIESGAKGNWFNVAQIVALLGQQNLLGKRIPDMLEKNRSLHSYPFKKMSVEEKFESKGFIHNSFIHGLNPAEYFYHTMVGRSGVIDTSQGTSITGYLNHKMAVLLANLSVSYDNTVRNDSNKVVQILYNDDGFDPTRQIMINNEPQFCDVKRIAQKLNNE